MSSIRIVHVAGTKMVSVIDETSGLVETVEVSAMEDAKTVDTIVEDEPEATSRRFYIPKSE